MRRLVSALVSGALLAAPIAASAQEAEPIAPRLEALAEAGNAEAAYYLGMLHLLGREGAAKDEKKAFELFQKSAAGGDPLGDYRLGDYYAGEPKGVAEANGDLALHHKLKSAEAGFAVAQHDAAQLLYERGDTAAALRWLEAAAKQGHAPSLQALSSLYSGEGKVEKHEGRSLAYLLLLYSTTKKKPSEKIQAWIKETQAKLTPDQAKEADRIIRTFAVRPTPLTLRALAGEAEAKKLAASAPAPAAPAAEDAAATNEPAPAEEASAPETDAAPAVETAEPATAVETAEPEQTDPPES